MKRKIFFVPIDEIVGFAKSVTENQFKTIIVCAAHDVVVFSVEYQPQTEKSLMIDLELSIKQGCCIDRDYRDDDKVWIRRISP